MLTMRGVLGGMLAVLLVSGGVACGEKPTVSKETALRVKANAGDASAQFNLGVMYRDGQGVSQDDAQAVSWYRKAAEQGHSDAQYSLGTMYDIGQGIPQDDGQAVSWYRKAAEQGHSDAQLNLGVRYDFGRGVPQDYGQGASWYRKAAAQGDARALFNLGVRYRNGLGVPEDAVSAYMWFNLSAARSTGETQKDSATARDDTAKTMTPAQLTEAQTLAREWFAAFEKRGGK